MRRAFAVLAFGLIAAAAPAGADDWSVSLRLGGFFPKAGSDLFNDDVALYRVEKKDFVGVTGGIEFNAALFKNLEIGVHVDGYGREIDTSYRDYTRENGDEIGQTLRVSFVPIGATIRLVPTSRHVPVAPYLAVGADAIIWEYEEEGDFIDFFDDDLPIIPDHFKSNGVALGVHAAAGLRVYVSDDVAILGEVRYQWADTPEMKDDFARAAQENHIDVQGLSATVGVHVRF